MTKKVDIQPKSFKIPNLILFTAKFLELFSSKLVTLFAAKIFTTPIKYKIPKREFHMEINSNQIDLNIPILNKKIVTYHYGNSNKKIMLVHGWSGRGTQLVKIADELIDLGFSTISFDAPAHGKSKSNSTLLPEFIECILEIDKQFGPFEFAIGHSLGGMSILNAISNGFNIKKAIIIGSGDIIQDIIDDFITELKLKSNISIKLKDHFEHKFNTKMDRFSSSNVAKKIEIPILIIHDKDDKDVNIKAAFNIDKNLINSKLLITEGLGHRKILGNLEVISQIRLFLLN